MAEEKERSQAEEGLPIRSPIREKIWHIIFEAESPAGRLYDIGLLILIVLSVVAMMLDTVDTLASRHGKLLLISEWIFTILFAIDYFVRIWCVRRKARYVFSFFGIIDFLAWFPILIALGMGSSGRFVGIVRILRTLRIFRILKMARHMGEANVLLEALAASRAKITVFLFGILSIVMVMGTVMYLVESPVNERFSSIPESVYWAIVTITTVGYGDISPVTMTGKFLASFMMIAGYAIIAVPTGIVSSEIVRASHAKKEEESYLVERLRCTNCAIEDHRQTAEFCYGCGTPLRFEAVPREEDGDGEGD